jgi:hypothetical protein
VAVHVALDAVKLEAGVVGGAGVEIEEVQIVASGRRGELEPEREGEALVGHTRSIHLKAGKLKIESLTLPFLKAGKLKIESLTLPFHLKAGKLKIESLTLPSLTLPSLPFWGN